MSRKRSHKHLWLQMMCLQKNFCSCNRWLPEKIVFLSGPVSFIVELVDWRRKWCDQDHLRADDGGLEMSEVTPEESISASPSTTPGTLQGVSAPIPH